MEYFTTEYSIHFWRSRSGAPVDGGGEQGALAGAQGKMVLFLATLLQRAGVMKAGEFAALLAVFAETVAETAPEEGALLAAWAAEVGEAQPH